MTQVYHSKISNPTPKRVGNFALLSFKTKVRGPVAILDKHDTADDMDIIDEALFYFRANVFFKTYEIQGDSDRVMIYLTLYITECLKKLQKCVKKSQALNEMHSLAINKFDIPGDSNFVLPTVYTKPPNTEDAGRKIVVSTQYFICFNFLSFFLPLQTHFDNIWLNYDKNAVYDCVKRFSNRKHPNRASGGLALPKGNFWTLAWPDTDCNGRRQVLVRVFLFL